MLINGFYYEAHAIQPKLWMIKRFEDPSNTAYYVEALIEVDTDNYVVAIQEAIERDSWA